MKRKFVGPNPNIPPPAKTLGGGPSMCEGRAPPSNV